MRKQVPVGLHLLVKKEIEAWGSGTCWRGGSSVWGTSVGHTRCTAHDQRWTQAFADLVRDRVCVACKLGSLVLLEVPWESNILK